jgi:transposase
MHPENTIPFTLPGFAIDQVDENESRLVIQAHSTATQSICPMCGQTSTYVHSNYIRTPRDLPCSGRQVCLRLQVQRFRCRNTDCQRTTFAERLPELVPVHGQRTHRLTTAARTLALELCAEASARVMHHLNMALSGDTLLRILRQIEFSPGSPVQVLGVDDWAFKKGRQYGTLLVDLEQHCPIDLLPDRTAETLARWLQAHPGITVICRDRSQEYKAGITHGAPHAIQVADRWHLLSNLGDTLQRLLDRHPKALRTAARTTQAQIQSETTIKQQAEPEKSAQANLDTPSTATQTYRQARFAEVKALAAEGLSKRAIALQLHMHRRTVSRYLQLDELPKRPTPTHNVSTVTPYYPKISLAGNQHYAASRK